MTYRDLNGNYPRGTNPFQFLNAGRPAGFEWLDGESSRDPCDCFLMDGDGHVDTEPHMEESSECTIQQFGQSGPVNQAELPRGTDQNVFGTRPCSNEDWDISNPEIEAIIMSIPHDQLLDFDMVAPDQLPADDAFFVPQVMQRSQILTDYEEDTQPSFLFSDIPPSTNVQIAMPDTLPSGLDQATDPPPVFYSDYTFHPLLQPPVSSQELTIRPDEHSFSGLSTTHPDSLTDIHWLRAHAITNGMPPIYRGLDARPPLDFVYNSGTVNTSAAATAAPCNARSGSGAMSHLGMGADVSTSESVWPQERTDRFYS